MASNQSHHLLGVFDDDMEISSDVGRRDDDDDIDIDFGDQEQINVHDYMSEDETVEALNESSHNNIEDNGDDYMIDDVGDGRERNDGSMEEDHITHDEELQDATFDDEGDTEIVQSRGISDITQDPAVDDHVIGFPPAFEEQQEFEYMSAEIGGEAEQLLVGDSHVEVNHEAFPAAHPTEDVASPAVPSSSTADVSDDFQSNFFADGQTGTVAEQLDANHSETYGDPPGAADNNIDDMTLGQISQVAVTADPVQDIHSPVGQITRSPGETTELPTEIDANTAETGKSHLPEHPSFETYSTFDSHHHSVIVQYDGTEYDLFPTNEESSSRSCLLSDSLIVNSNLQELLGHCRDALGDRVSDDDELDMDVAELGLTLSEDSSHASVFSLADMLDVFVQLCQNDDIDHPDPLCITLTTKPRFAARMTELSSAVRDGRGLSHLSFVENDIDQYDSDADERTEKISVIEETHNSYSGENEDKAPSVNRANDTGEDAVEADSVLHTAGPSHDVVTESDLTLEGNVQGDNTEELWEQTHANFAGADNLELHEVDAKFENQPTLSDENEDDLLDYSEEDGDAANDSNWSSSTTLPGDDLATNESKPQLANEAATDKQEEVPAASEDADYQGVPHRDLDDNAEASNDTVYHTLDLAIEDKHADGPPADHSKYDSSEPYGAVNFSLEDADEADADVATVQKETHNFLDKDYGTSEETTQQYKSVHKPGDAVLKATTSPSRKRSRTDNEDDIDGSDDGVEAKKVRST